MVAARDIIAFAVHELGATVIGSQIDFDVVAPASIGSMRAGTVGFMSHPIPSNVLPEDRCIVVASERVGSEHAVTIIVERPRLAFGEILAAFFVQRPPAGAHPSVIIDPSATVDPTASIGAFTVIGPDCHIGSGTIIGRHVVLSGMVRLGAECVIMSHAVIGEAGFGIEVRQDGSLLRLAHVGGVTIEDGVHIGNFTAVASGTLEPTVIGEGTQIDNLVHVAHNVRIGRNCQIAASAEISGSVVLEDDVYIAPRVAINQKLKVGTGSFIGTGSTVTRSIPPDSLAYGAPAKVVRRRSE